MDKTELPRALKEKKKGAHALSEVSFCNVESCEGYADAHTNIGVFQYEKGLKTTGWCRL
jgi:hypothetical protein